MTTPTDAPESCGDDESAQLPQLPQLPHLPPPTPPAPTLAQNGPTLPPAAPTVPEAAAAEPPILPSAPPVVQQPTADSYSKVTGFDAKAMVESQKHHVANPAYGAMPQATPESMAATEALRAKAHRKRQRNKMLGWMVALFMLGGIGVAGWFAYQAYQDDQNQETDASDDENTTVLVPGALSPLGNQEQIIELLEDTTGGVTPSAGGLLGAVEDAQVAIDDLNGDAEAGATQTTIAAGTIGTGTAPPAGPAVLPSFRSIGFNYRLYETAAVGSPFTDYAYNYDHLDDNYWAMVMQQAVDGSLNNSLYVFTGESRAVFRADGSGTMLPRSDASRDPAIDSPWATVFSEEVVLPAAARAHARPISVPEGSGSDLGMTVTGFQLDIDAWRGDDPAGHAAWLAFWTAPAADSDTLVSNNGRQRLGESFESGSLQELRPADLSDVEAPIAIDGAGVSFGLSDDGHVRTVIILNEADDFRVVWDLVDLSEGPAQIGFDDMSWVDDP